MKFFGGTRIKNVPFFAKLRGFLEFFFQKTINEHEEGTFSRTFLKFSSNEVNSDLAKMGSFVEIWTQNLHQKTPLKNVSVSGFEPRSICMVGSLVQADIHYTTAADDFVLLASLYIVDCFISQK